MDLLQNDEKPMKIRLKFAIRNSIKSFRYSIIFNYDLEEKEGKEFKTEEIKSKKDNSLIEFESNLCCDYYFYKIQKIKITVKKLKLGAETILKNYFIEENNILTLSTIVSSKNGSFQDTIDKSYDPGNKDNLKEILMIKAENDFGINKNSISLNKNTFIDYIISGIKFKCFIGIDFSDKKYQNMNELKNEYLLSIRGIRETLYDFKVTFEVFGFDYILKQDEKHEKNDELFLNLNKDNIDNKEFTNYTPISYAYYEFLNRIDLSNEIKKEEKKNKLSPLIYHLLNQIYASKNSNYYNIVFILINSLNEEQFKNCIDCFTKSFFLPISFVIIGIGEDENKFQKIKKLCEINKGKNGVKKYRNNTFFITMKECEYSSEIIKNKCLQKIPEQLCEFYESNKISLEEIKKNNLSDKNSLRIFETYNSLISQMNFGDKDKNIINNVEPSFNEIKMNNNDKEMNIGNKEFNNEITPDGENNIDINIDINKNRNIDINIDVNKKVKNNSLKKKNPDKNQKKYKIKGSSLNASLGKNINENPYNDKK